jgi:hypothetical protein
MHGTKDKYTFSYAYFDDLKQIEYQEYKIDNLKYKTIEKCVRKIYDHEEYKGFKYSIESYLNSFPPTSAEQDIKEVVENLCNDGYSVWNRVNKYYVVAFAIDYVRFDIYSKDCDKELIDWGADKNGDIVNINTDEDYNKNPVTKIIDTLLNYG